MRLYILPGCDDLSKRKPVLGHWKTIAVVHTSIVNQHAVHTQA